MITRRLGFWALVMLFWVGDFAYGQHGHASHVSAHMHGGSTMAGPMGGSAMSSHHGTNHNGWGYGGGGYSVINYSPSIFFGYSQFGYVPFAPTFFVGAPGGFLPNNFGPNAFAIGPMPLTAPGLDPLALALTPVMNVPPAARPAPAPARPRRVDPARVAELVTIGDRLFRAGNLTRAAERYDQAAKANPQKAAPLVHLSQIALVRGKFNEAANRLREAQAAEPGWLATATDIQGLFGEPGDFAAQIAKLEAHLQANPGDRDAWLVLGAEWYLSGRTQKAADVFLRLSDRVEDPMLQAFLEASKAAPR